MARRWLSSWSVCLALLTAFSYSRLSVAYPSRGGSVVFIDRVFGVRLATGVLNNLLWFGYLVTLSLYAVAFANYAATSFTSTGTPLRPWLLHLLISAAIAVPTGLNLLSAFIAISVVGETLWLRHRRVLQLSFAARLTGVTGTGPVSWTSSAVPLPTGPVAPACGRPCAGCAGD